MGIKDFLYQQEIAEELKKIEATKDKWKVKGFETISTPKGFRRQKIFTTEFQEIIISLLVIGAVLLFKLNGSLFS